MNKRSFLKVGAVITAVLAVESGVSLSLNSKKSEILEGSRFLEEIEGIKIFVNQEISDTDNILVKVLKNLRKMLSFLPKELTREVSLIQLKFVSNEEYNVGGLAYIQIGAIQINVLRENILKWDESAIEKAIASVLFHEITHLITYKKYSSFASERMAQAYICRSPSNEVCKNFFTYLVTTEDLNKWLSISRDNGDYLNIKLNNENIAPEKFQRRNFGYVLGSPKLRYGVLNLLEDIACVFEQIIYRLYLLSQREEYTKEDAIKKEIAKLLTETLGETGLWEKYQIACKSLIEQFQNEKKQELDPANKTKLENLIYVLQVFRSEIEAAIKIEIASVLNKKQSQNQQPMGNEGGGFTQFDSDSQGNRQIASVDQEGGQQTSTSPVVTRRGFLLASLRRLFVRGGGRRII